MDTTNIKSGTTFKIFMGERIKLARKAMNLSQDQLAQLVGKNQNAISEYEQGERLPSTTAVYTLSQILHVPIEYFFPTPSGARSFDETDTSTKYHENNTSELTPLEQSALVS